MFVSSNIKYLRNKLGLTQVELAQQLEKTSAAVSDYEKGKSLPPLDVAFRISQFFRIGIDELVGKDLRKEDILLQEGILSDTDAQYQTKYEQLLKQLHTQERLNALLEQRLVELEREIREQAPELAKRLGLG